MKLTYLSGITFLLVFGALASEHFLVFRSDLNQRAQSATSFRKLLDQGLLKSYEFKPYVKNPILKESVSANERLELQSIAKELSQYKFTIFSNELNKNKSKGHSDSIKKWEAFFKRHKINYSKITRLYNANVKSIWVIPSYERILVREKKALESHILQGGKVLLTGAFGIYEEDSRKDNKKADYSWFEKITDLKITKIKDSEKTRPSSFVSKGAPLWNLPPGLTLNLDVNNDELVFLSNDDSVKAYETDYENHLIKYSGFYAARYKVITRQENDIVWTQHDPVTSATSDPTNENVDISFYSDSIFLHSLNWISKNKIARISNWPQGKAFSSVLSIDAESKFENIITLIEDLKEYKLPVTVFTVSDLYNKAPEAFEMLSKEEDEVGFHSNDHEVMTKFTLFENFKRLQKSRLDIEQLYHKEVTGFRPPEERFNLETLNAVRQNKFSYIFAGQDYLRYSPIVLSESDLIFYPRVVRDDFAISKNPLLSTAKKVSELMTEELKKVEMFGGAYFFSMHTHIFGEHEFYQEGMTKFYKHLVKQDVWSTNFKEMTSWWKKRRNLSVQIESLGSGQLYLLVKNDGEKEVSDLSVQVNLKSRKSKGIEKRLPANSSLNKNSDIINIAIETIGAGKTLRIPLTK